MINNFLAKFSASRNIGLENLRADTEPICKDLEILKYKDFSPVFLLPTALGSVLGLRPSTARLGRLAVGEERQERRRAAEERLERIGVRGSLRGEAIFLGEERSLEGDW